VIKAGKNHCVMDKLLEQVFSVETGCVSVRYDSRTPERAAAEAEMVQATYEMAEAIS
jgi:hypothetical protein